MKPRGLGLLFAMLTVTLFAAPPALVPLPQLMQTNPGSFTLCPPQIIPGAPAPATTTILEDGAGRETAEYLAALLFKSTGYRFQIATTAGGSPVAQAILLTLTSVSTRCCCGRRQWTSVRTWPFAFWRLRFQGRVTPVRYPKRRTP